MQAESNVAEMQTSFGEANSNPVVCDQPAVSPQAILLGAPLLHGALPTDLLERFDPAAWTRHFPATKGMACDQVASGAMLGGVRTFTGGTGRLLTTFYRFRALWVLANRHRSRS